MRNKTAWIIIISVIAFVILAMVAIALGHSLYSARQEAIITDYGSLEVSDSGLIYRYADELKSVDITGAFKVSSGANYEITKITDEDGTVTRGEGKVIDLSDSTQRIATVEVTSASKKNTNDYKITFIPKSCENNVITYSLGGGAIEGDYLSSYSGGYDIVLPTPTKTYTAPGTGNVYVYDFEGWYTTPDFQEGTEITSISKGTSGEVELYAKYAAPQIQGSREGYQYVLYGYYPQTRVTDYLLVKSLRQSTEYNAVKGNSIGFFTYGGNPYCYFVPSNVANLAENGYSAGATYFFYVEQVEWLVLKPKNQTVSGGEHNVYLLSTSILNCGSYSDNGGTIQNLYKQYVNQLGEGFNLTNFERVYFDPDTMYAGGIKSVVDGVYDTMASFSSLADYNPSGLTLRSRSFKKYTNVITGASESYSCNMWLLNYSEVRNTSFGFSADYKENDPLRKAYCSDFAAACGVYRSTSFAHKDQGSWWLRGANDDYNYSHKHVAYVKYTGYAHTYGAMNFAIRSGVRPSIMVDF